MTKHKRNHKGCGCNYVDPCQCITPLTVLKDSLKQTSLYTSPFNIYGLQQLNTALNNKLLVTCCNQCLTNKIGAIQPPSQPSQILAVGTAFAYNKSSNSYVDQNNLVQNIQAKNPPQSAITAICPVNIVCPFRPCDTILPPKAEPDPDHLLGTYQWSSYYDRLMEAGLYTNNPKSFYACGCQNKCSDILSDVISLFKVPCCEELISIQKTQFAEEVLCLLNQGLVFYAMTGPNNSTCIYVTTFANVPSAMPP